MHKNSLTLATGMAPANQNVLFQSCPSQALGKRGGILHCRCLHNGFGRGYEGIKTFNSVLTAAFVDPCCISISVLAHRSFQSSLLYMNFTATIIHVQFHRNKQITQQSRSYPFPWNYQSKSSQLVKYSSEPLLIHIGNF